MGIVRTDRYVRGTHNVISDRSGQKFKRKDMMFTWDNLLVGKDEWEPRQPQDLIRGRKEQIAVTDGARLRGPVQPLQDPPNNEFL